MVRIIHTGDMHFDSPFSALPYKVAKNRKEEQKDTFMRIIEFAQKYKTDVFLIAGDMFDSRFVSFETISFLKKCFSQIKETTVCIAPGNHDFISSDSPYMKIDFGDNVHIFGDEVERIEVGDAIVYGCGFSSQYQHVSLLPLDFKHIGDKTGILLMHADVSQESDYNPITESFLSQTGLTYAALGHVHTYTGVKYAGATQYAYCGIPEGRHFDETAQCGFIFGEVDGTESEFTFMPFAKRCNEKLDVDISDCACADDILKKIRGKLTKENLYKISLCGEIKNTLYIDSEYLQRELSDDCFYIKIIDKTKTYFDGNEESFLEKVFIERLSGKNDAISQMALRFGIEALRGQKR